MDGAVGRHRHADGPLGPVFLRPVFGNISYGMGPLLLRGLACGNGSFQTHFRFLSSLLGLFPAPLRLLWDCRFGFAEKKERTAFWYFHVPFFFGAPGRLCLPRWSVGLPCCSHRLGGCLFCMAVDSGFSDLPQGKCSRNKTCRACCKRNPLGTRKCAYPPSGFCLYVFCVFLVGEPAYFKVAT